MEDGDRQADVEVGQLPAPQKTTPAQAVAQRIACSAVQHDAPHPGQGIVDENVRCDIGSCRRFILSAFMPEIG